MEILALVFLWPLLIFAVGLVFISMNDVFPIGLAYGWIFIIILLFTVFNKKRGSEKPKSNIEQLEKLRNFLITFSAALLIPLFVRYLTSTFDNSLIIIILSLIFCFCLIVWGMFSQTRKIIMYSNITGGFLALAYLYSKLWELGDLTRIFAAALGLIIAVVISIIKLKDKLI